MKEISIASLVSLSLVLATVPNVTLAQPPTADAHDGPRPVRLELDGRAIGTRAVGLENHLREELAPVFEKNDAEIVGPESDAPLVRIRIGGQFKDIELFKYELNFELVEGDKVSKLLDPAECKECYDEEIVAAVAQRVPALLKAIEERTAAAGAVESDTGNGDGGDGDGDDSTEPPPKAIGPLGFAGIGVVVAGVGLTIGGAVEWSRGRIDEQDESFYEIAGNDHRPVGYALMGVGAAATVAGLVMLGVDMGRRAKLRKQARAQVLIIPSISPANAGVGIVGRF